MYSTRKFTPKHGNHQLTVLIVNIIIMVVFTARYGTDYLVIYLSSGMLLTMLEFLLVLRGARKGTVTVYGKQLSPFTDCLLRAFVEGPGLCLPAFFMADHLFTKSYVVGIGIPTFIIGVGALFSGLRDKRDIKDGEEVRFSRRKMTKAGVVITVAFIDLICLSSLFLMDEPFKTHGFYFLFSFFYLMQLFFFINAVLGVRMIQRYDEDKKEFYTAGPVFSAIAFTYDAVFEMALLNLPYYLIPYAFGLFKYASMK